MSNDRCNVANRTIFCHDNLEILRGINTASIDLIYLDPPFNKKKVFTAPIGSSAEGASFKDIFTKEDVKAEWVQEIKEDWYRIHELLSAVKNIEGRTSYNFCYLSYMAIRLIECHRVLKNTGSIYLHCDPTMSHYLKILLDCIFGEKQFRNELVWHYGRWTAKSNSFQKQHDIILLYAKSEHSVFNQLYDKHSTMSLKEYRFVEKADGTVEHIKGTHTYDQLLALEGEVFRTLRRKDTKGTAQNRMYLKANKGVRHSSVFLGIPYLSGSAKERTGYPTQKPLALLERIIQASSNTGDIVLDPFCGCATTCVAAEKLERQWIGIDISVKAYQLVQTRIKDEVYEKGLFVGVSDHEGEALKMPDIHCFTYPPHRTDDGAQTQPTKYIYVISNDHFKGVFKVGIAGDVKSRLNSYQTGDPDRKYKLCYSISTPYFREIEKYIHHKYLNQYEWVEGDLQDIIADIENYDPQKTHYYSM